MASTTYTAGERIEGDRKVRVRVSGSDARALQDAADYLNGYQANYARREQIAKRLVKVVERYRLMDESQRKSKGE